MLIMAIILVVLFIINVVWFGWNLFLWVTNGIQFLLHGMNFVERVYASIILKWIILADLLYILIAVISLFVRKSFKTNASIYYLKYEPLNDPKISVSLNVYNEEPIIHKVVNDFVNQKYVSNVIVIDNHSTDKTVDIARRCGATVIVKDFNKGYADSWILGLKESLKTDANIIAIADIDGTYNAYDLSKMIPYLDNCDMVMGNRLVQHLTEKENQNTMFYVWGNWFIAKLFQLKFFNLLHRGHIQISDVGCSYRCFRREALEKIIHEFNLSDNQITPEINDTNIILFTNNVAIRNNLKVIEIPITFNRRVGRSKYTDTKRKGLKAGLVMLWYILKS